MMPFFLISVISMFRCVLQLRIEALSFVINGTAKQRTGCKLQIYHCQDTQPEPIGLPRT